MANPFGQADFWRRIAELFIDGLKIGGVLEKKDGSAKPPVDGKKPKKDDKVF